MAEKLFSKVEPAPAAALGAAGSGGSSSEPPAGPQVQPGHGHHILPDHHTTARLNKVLHAIQDRSDIIALAAIVGVTLLLAQFPGARSKDIPGGIYGFGIVSGAALALNGMGMLLIYRAHRIINFAQAQLGLVAGTVFVTLVQYRPVFRLVQKACPPCLRRITPTMELINYWLSVVFAFGVALLLAFLIYTLIVKRFANAPRLVLTVATIFIIQILGLVQGQFGELLRGGQTAGRTQAFRLPFDLNFKWGDIPFRAPDILMVVFAATAAIGLMAYYRFSRTGAGLRASAENPVRAATMGVDVNRVNSRVWLIAGGLSALAGMLSAMSFGVSPDAKLDVGIVVRMLAVAVIARMVNLPVGVAAAIAISILERTIFWTYGTDVFVDGVLLFVITAVLLLQRHKVTRAEIEQAGSWRPAREVRPIPRELRAVGTVRNTRIALGILVAVFLLGIPWLVGAGEISLGAVIILYAMVGLSLLVLTGWAGQISLGQFAFAAVGAYVAAVSRLPMPVAVIVGALAAGVTAVVVGIPALKLRGLHLAITTLSFALAVPALLLNSTYLGRFLPEDLKLPSFLGVDLEEGRTFYYVTLVILTLIAVAVAGVRRGVTARALIAARDNEPGAQSFGINLLRARLGAFALAGFIAGLAGALYGFQQHGVRPEAFPAELSVDLFIMAVIGGLGSVAGPLIGAGYRGFTTIVPGGEIVTQLLGVAGGLGLLMLVPGGLSQLIFGLRDNWLRRVAQRRGIDVPSLLGPKDQRGERAPIAGKLRMSATEFEPRYQLRRQWALGSGGERLAERPSDEEKAPARA